MKRAQPRIRRRRCCSLAAAFNLSLTLPSSARARRNSPPPSIRAKSLAAACLPHLRRRSKPDSHQLSPRRSRHSYLAPVHSSSASPCLTVAPLPAPLSMSHHHHDAVMPFPSYPTGDPPPSCPFACCVGEER
jgi:hypothetical protein